MVVCRVWKRQEATPLEKQVVLGNDSDTVCTGRELRALIWWLHSGKNLCYCLSFPTTSPRYHDG